MSGLKHSMESGNAETIYVQLLDEGTICYRPVTAKKLGENTYELGGYDIYDLEDEHWEFKPGTIVITEVKILRDSKEEEWPVAVKENSFSWLQPNIIAKIEIITNLFFICETQLRLVLYFLNLNSYPEFPFGANSGKRLRRFQTQQKNKKNQTIFKCNFWVANLCRAVDSGRYQLFPPPIANTGLLAVFASDRKQIVFPL